MGSRALATLVRQRQRWQLGGGQMCSPSLAPPRALHWVCPLVDVAEPPLPRPPAGAVVDLSRSDTDSRTLAEALAGYVWVCDLNLHNCRGVTDLGALGGHTLLRRLVLSGTRITAAGIATLRECTGLVELYCAKCELLDDVQPIAALPHLRRLDISHTAVPFFSLARLAQCESLRELKWMTYVSVAGTAVVAEEIAVLRHCVDLEELDCRGCAHLANVSILGAVASLCVVELSGSAVTVGGISGLLGCPKLRRLGVSGCPSLDVAALRALPWRDAVVLDTQVPGGAPKESASYLAVSITALVILGLGMLVGNA